MSMDNNINKFLEELIQEVEKELDETTATGNVAGYQTPNAFSDKGKSDKKRKKKIATTLGYSVVDNDVDNISEAIKGRNNKTGEAFGMVIGSDKKNREGNFEVTIRISYSSRISSYTFIFDNGSNLITIKDYGYSMDGKFPDMKGSASVKSVKPNPRETITQIAKITSPAFAKKIVQHVKKVKESVNELLVIVDKFDKNKQDYGKIYYRDGGMRPGDGDINKAKKELAKLSKKHKDLTLVSVGRNSKMYDVMDESVNEGKKRFKRQDGIGKAKYTISFHDGKKKHKDGSDFFDIKIFKNKKDLSDFVGTLAKQGYQLTRESVNEASKLAMGIAGFTGTRGSAVDAFIDSHKIDAKKLFNFVKKGNLKDRMAFVSAIAGRPDNKMFKMITKQFGESVNEDKVSNGTVSTLEKGIQRILGTKVNHDINRNGAHEFYIDDAEFVIGVNDGTEKKVAYSFSIYDDGARKYLGKGTSADEKDLIKQVLSIVKKYKKQLLLTTESVVNEAKSKRPVNRWLELKNDESMHAHKKMAMGLKELKYQLRETEKFFNWYNKIKTMNELDSNQYWKRTNSHIYKIKERLINIARTIQEIEKWK